MWGKRVGKKRATSSSLEAAAISISALSPVIARALKYLFVFN